LKPNAVLVTMNAKLFMIRTGPIACLLFSFQGLCAFGRAKTPADLPTLWQQISIHFERSCV